MLFLQGIRAIQTSTDAIFIPQTSARQLPASTQSSGPQPGNSTLSSLLLLEAVVIKL